MSPRIRRRPRVTIALALLAAFAIVLTACGAELGAPLPLFPGDAQLSSKLSKLGGGGDVPDFVGIPATPKPLDPLGLTENPYLAPQGRNALHGDTSNSGTHPYPGPLGNEPEVNAVATDPIAGPCPTAVFDDLGRLITVCIHLFSVQLMLVEPDTMDILAVANLAPRASSASLDFGDMLNDSSGGGYFHLDAEGRAVVGTADKSISIYEVVDGAAGPEWALAEKIDLSAHLPGDKNHLIDVTIDWEARYWFLTRQGVVGYYEPAAATVETFSVPGDEGMENSLAVDPDGGVYIVSTHAVYRLGRDATSGAVVEVWRHEYDRGSATQGALLSHGSGTSPTLLGDDLVAIADNADGRINVVVLERAAGVPDAEREVCKVPVFADGASATENSLIGYDRSVIVENNAGFKGFFGNAHSVKPGLWRIDVRDDLSGCDVVWRNDTIVSSTTPKLSTANGLVYLYTLRKGTPSWIQAWYATAVDFESGEIVFETFAGSGKGWDNVLLPVALTPSGTYTIGTLNGFVSVRDTA